MKHAFAAAAALLLLCQPHRAPAAAAGTGTPGFYEVAQTPAYELLEALDLLEHAQSDSRAAAAAFKRADGAYTVRLKLKHSALPTALTARGRALLQYELANVEKTLLTDFDLLYNPAGRLIAAFPVFSAEFLSSGTGKQEWWRKLHPTFFDFSPYYMAVPGPDDPLRIAKWRDFASVYAEDQSIIRAFVDQHFRAVKEAYPEFAQITFPYRLHELDKETGDWRGYQFNPLIFRPELKTGAVPADTDEKTFMAAMSAAKPDKHRTVLPAFPTVYSLARPPLDETTYLRYVYSRFPLPSDPELLVIGPGTGVDTWIASFRTARPVNVIGINPLEVANTRASARLAGFRVNPLVGDNIADMKGRPRFRRKKFDAVFWNMPAVRRTRAERGYGPSMQDFWDGDANSRALRCFAAGLPAVLKSGGRALLWNTGVYSDEVNLIAETLERAGTTGRVFNVETERFVDRSKPTGFLEGHIYTLSLSGR